MPPVGFEPTISAGERLKTYALDLAATGIGCVRKCIVPQLCSSKLNIQKQPQKKLQTFPVDFDLSIEGVAKLFGQTPYVLTDFNCSIM